MKPTCSLVGCDQPLTAKGYCMAHYTRWRRTGDPGEAEIWDKRRSQCAADECDREATSRGWCNKHYLRWYRHRDLGRNNHKANHTRWLDRESLNYDAAHDRVKRYRGVASSHACACGEPAVDWAYLHTDPDPLRDERDRPFSENVHAYAPMCRHCHKTFDWAIKRQAAAS